MTFPKKMKNEITVMNGLDTIVYEAKLCNIKYVKPTSLLQAGPDVQAELYLKQVLVKTVLRTGILEYYPLQFTKYLAHKRKTLWKVDSGCEQKIIYIGRLALPVHLLRRQIDKKRISVPHEAWTAFDPLVKEVWDTYRKYVKQ